MAGVSVACRLAVAVLPFGFDCGITGGEIGAVAEECGHGCRLLPRATKGGRFASLRTGRP